MNQNHILHSMAEISETYIQEANPDLAEGCAPTRKRRPLRTALIAAAVAALLATAALAISPTLREVLQNTLGGFAPYTQDLTEQDVSCTDQGIKVRVVSALNDGNTIAIYFEAQDLTGDRLDEFTTTNTQIRWPKDQVEWKQGMLFLPERIAFIEETKTVLYYTGFIGDGVPAERLTLSLHGQSFIPGSRSFDEPIPDEAVSKSVLKTETLPDGVILVPMQNPTSLIEDCLTLSSCGFGEDGLFHIQLRAGAGMSAGLLPLVQSREFVSGQKTYGEVKHYDRLSEIRFEREGLLYYDFSFQAAPEDAGDLVIHQLLGTVHKEKIEGEWRLDVPLESQPSTVISMDQSGTELAIGPKATKLFLSPISCTVECDPKGGKYSLGYPLSVFRSDGSILSGVKSDSNYWSDTYATNHWTFPEPIDPDGVTAIAIGQWYVPIENGAAQPGHWLAEAP